MLAAMGRLSGIEFEQRRNFGMANASGRFALNFLVEVGFLLSTLVVQINKLDMS